MEKFLVEKSIHLNESKQLKFVHSSLSGLLDQLHPDTIINLTDQGNFELELLHEIQNPDSTKNLIVLIGGYQRGEDVQPELLNKQIIIDSPTTAWMILNILYSGNIIEKKRLNIKLIKKKGSRL